MHPRRGFPRHLKQNFARHPRDVSCGTPEKGPARPIGNLKQSWPAARTTRPEQRERKGSEALAEVVTTEAQVRAQQAN